MSIRHWPGAERPREKLLERGAHALSDAELLALLLGSGIRGHSAVELARRHFREALCVGPALAAPDATRTFLVAQLRDRPYEVFCCLYLDLCVADSYVEHLAA